MSDTTDDEKVETEIMIIGTDKILATSPPKTTLDHFLNGARGQTATCIQRTPDDLRLMFSDAKARDKKYGPKLFLLAPFKEMTDAFLLSVAWPLLAFEFAIPPEEGVIFRHSGLPRPNGGADTHYHVAVNYADPDSDWGFRNWSWDRPRVEKCSRIIEILTDEKVLVGRFQDAVIKKLHDMGEHEYAVAIELANPPNARPAGRTEKRQVEQPAKRKGIDLRKLGKQVREAYRASDGIDSFKRALADTDFKLTLAASFYNPNSPVWALYDESGTFVKNLTGCFNQLNADTINQKIGEPSNEQPADPAQLNLIDAINATIKLDAAAARGDEREPHAVDSGASTGVRGNDPGHADGVYQLAARGQHDDDEQASLLFVEALRAAPAERVIELVKAAYRVTRNPITEVLEYIRAKAAFARKYIARKAAELPPPNDVLANIRNIRASLTTKIASIRSAWVQSELILGGLSLEKPPPAVGAKAHDDRIEKARKKVTENEAKVAQAERALADYKKETEVFEEYYNNTTVPNHRKEIMAGELWERANRYIRVEPRMTALIADDKGPRVAFFGAEGLFEYACEEDRRAGPTAKFRITGPPPEAPDFAPPDDVIKTPGL